MCKLDAAVNKQVIQDLLVHALSAFAAALGLQVPAAAKREAEQLRSFDIAWLISEAAKRTAAMFDPNRAPKYNADLARSKIAEAVVQLPKNMRATAAFLKLVQQDIG